MKLCRVSYRDKDGTEHSCEVEATSMYEAIGFALARFRLSPEIDQPDPPSAWVEMTIEPREPTTAHKITRRQFDEWLERRGSTPKEITARRRVREALGVPEEKL